MLRTEAEAAANELIAALETSALYYRHAATRLSADAESLRSTAAERERLRDALADAIREQGDLPDALNPEEAMLQEWKTRVRSRLAGEASGMRAALRESDKRLALAARQVESVPASPRIGELASEVRRAVAGQSQPSQGG